MMSARDGVMAAVVLAFLAGLFHPTRQAEATVPNACPKYECKNVYSWWDAWPVQVFAANQAGSDTVTTTYGYGGIFTPTSPDQNSGSTTGVYDKWVWTQCSPMCGKSNSRIAGMTWQLPQEVAPGGSGSISNGNRNLQRYICGQMPQGQTGPLASDSTNWNNNGDLDPPGWQG